MSLKKTVPATWKTSHCERVLSWAGLLLTSIPQSRFGGKNQSRREQARDGS